MQLPTGEIPSYRVTAPRRREYRRSPFLSTFVHDALACFDVRSGEDTSALDLVPHDSAKPLAAAARAVRLRISAFLTWQGEEDFTWRFYGRGSGIDPDSDTTSCAAYAALDSERRGELQRWPRYVEALRRFRSVDGRYFSYVNRRGQGYSWMDERGKAIVGFDRVVNANVLRYLASVGEDVGILRGYLESEAGRLEDLRRGTPDYPNPLCFPYCAARAWRQANLAGTDALRESLLPLIFEHREPDGSFGGPLSTAMALASLIDLGYRGPVLGCGKRALLSNSLSNGGWGYEDFFVHGFGSPAWTTALAIRVLASQATGH